MASQKVQYLRCSASLGISRTPMYAAFLGICDALILNFFLCHPKTDFLRVHHLLISLIIRAISDAFLALSAFFALSPASAPAASVSGDNALFPDAFLGFNSGEAMATGSPSRDIRMERLTL